MIRNVAQSRESYFRASNASSGNLASSRRLLSPSNSSALTPTAAAAAQTALDAPAPSPLGAAPDPSAQPFRSPSPSPPPTPPDAHTADGPLPLLRVPPPLDNTAYLCQTPHSATILEPSSVGDGPRRPSFHSPSAVGRTTPPFGSGALSAPFPEGDVDAAAAAEDDPDDTIALAAALEAKAVEDGTEDPGEAPVMPADGDTEGTDVGCSKPSGEGTGAIRRRVHSSSGAVSAGGSSAVEVTARLGAIPGGPSLSIGTPGVIPEEEIGAEEAGGDEAGPDDYSKAAQQAEAQHAATALRQSASAFSAVTVEEVELEGHGPFGQVALEPLPGAYSICILVCVLRGWCSAAPSAGCALCGCMCDWYCRCVISALCVMAA